MDLILYCWLLPVVIGLVSVWYIYVTWNFDYWKKQGVPGEKPYLLIGTFKPFWMYSVQDQDVEAMKKYGHVHGYSKKWKMVRNTLTPTFTLGKLKQMVYLIEECAEQSIDSLKDKIDIGGPIELTGIFSVLTLDVIASVAFGMKSDCIKNSNSEFVFQAQKIVQPNLKIIYLLCKISDILPVLKFFPLSLLRNPFKYFLQIADNAIDMRLKNKDFSRKDLLQIMLEAEIPNKTEENENQQKGIKKSYETTSNALSFLAYELASNHDIQEKLIKEVDDVMADKTLRKYPPFVRTDRVCEKDEYNLNGIKLKKE
uniref:Cytochrome P450 n=1 Tax=Strigamia maritima TaxID=126957 RepID=T1JMA8_STRMM